MFRFDGERWIPFERKVSYTQRYDYYIDADDIIPDYPDVVVEDIVLTEEELLRLETIKNIEEISLVDVIAYVKGGELRDEKTPDFIHAEEIEEERTALGRLIDVSTAPIDALRKMKVLIKQYDPHGYYKVKDLVEDEGELYVVLQAHQAQLDWKPKTTPALYAPKLTSVDGTPKAWVQPNSTNPYMKGNKVLWTDGKIYESLIDNNVWSPSAYPQGWKVSPIV